jgi:S1-C subfamily serine protease
MARSTSSWASLFIVALILLPALGAEKEVEPDGFRVSVPRNPTAYLGAWLSEAVDGGVQIIDVVPGGPAERAGLEVGDIVFEANRNSIALQADLNNILWILHPGDVLDLALLRNGETLNSRVRLGVRTGSRARWLSPSPDGPDRQDIFGLNVSEITPSLREFYKAPTAAGILVVRVQPQRLAERAGVMVGDVIVSIEEHPLQTADDLSATLRLDGPEKGLKISLIRKGAQLQLFLAAALDVAAIMKQDQLEHEHVERTIQIQQLLSELEMLEQQTEQIERILKELQENGDQPN